MFLYRFDPTTGKYLGRKEAELDAWQTEIKGSPAYKGEANAVWDAPLFEHGFTPFYRNGEWVNVPDPTEEEKRQQTQQRLTGAVQSWMDAEAQKLGYDSLLSVCSYISTGNAKFDAEGEAFRAWRSAVWAKGYELLAQALAGEIPIPSEEELIAMLPALSIEYPEAD